MDDIQQKVLAAFQSEHKKLLESMRRFLASQPTGNRASTSELDDLKRYAHTLKGAARAAGVELVQELGLRLERFFAGLQQGGIQLDDHCVRQVMTVLDGIERYVADMLKNPAASPPQQLLGLMDEVLGADNSPGNFKESGIAAGATAKPGPKGEPLSVQEQTIRHKVLAAFKNEYRTHLETLRELLDEMANGVQLSEEQVNTALRSAHTLKGSARAVDLPTVQQTAHSIETVFAGLREGTVAAETDVISAINKALDAVEDYVVSLSGPTETPIPQEVVDTIEKLAQSKVDDRPVRQTAKEQTKDKPPPEESPAADEATIRIAPTRLDLIQKTAEQFISEGLRQEEITREIKNLEKMALNMTKDMALFSAAIERTLPRMKNHPDVDEITNYVRGYRRLFPMLVTQIRDLGKRHTITSRINANLSGQMQASVQKARMVTAEDVFHHFRKMVRDLADDEGKQVALKVKGLNVQADRLVLQRLKDPLMHILRNAVSHGIESPQERKTAGKDPSGSIEFHIEIKGSRLWMTIEDDGKGLDFDQITEQAIKRGYLSAEQAENIDSHQLLSFIFQPGFTTAKMITDLSGRGVGMAVVRDAVDRLHGEIDVQSNSYGGTRFELRMPLTISTHRLLVVRAGEQTFGIPAHNIDRLFRIQTPAIASVEGHAVITYHQQTVPFAFLSDLLDFDRASPAENGDRLFVILLHLLDKKVALAVDEILAEAEYLIKDLPSPVDQIPYFTGGFVSADGRASLVLNPATLMDALQKKREGYTPFGESRQVKEKHQPQILIVDDSVTTRTLERTILESQGYEVHVAVDGVEALDLLGRLQVDLVVTDIQMPNMDGFALIEEMKKSDRLKEMPVIIVSSMADQKDRQRGMNLGADAYIVKQKFDQKNLLEAIGQIL